jgi:2-isopropylmalate synthase
MERTAIRVFDTTLRDGEQSPGCSMNVEEKLRMAHQLDRLGVDVIEAGFPIASEGDFAAVRAIAAALRRPIIAALARACREDIERAWEAVREAAHPRLHLFLATSDVHLEYKLRISRQQCFERATQSVARAKTLCDDVEFSPEDATRTDRDFLCQVVEAVIEAGATTINIPDTVGYATPVEFGELIQFLQQRVRGIEKTVISAHCHDDLGLAVANSLAAISQGARQVECTINGIGERAGNAALEEVVMALRVRPDRLPYDTAVVAKELYPASVLLSEIIGVGVQPNKAIIGRNAFAHEAGIHQDGVLKNPLTYEIMIPQSVGVPDSRLVLGKHSGRHALGLRYEQLGYRFETRELDDIYRRFVALADRIKQIEDYHLLDLIGSGKAPAQSTVPAPEKARGVAASGAPLNDTAIPPLPTKPSPKPDLPHFPRTPLADHHGEQEDYLWGV